MSGNLTATRRRALKALGAVSLAGGIGVQTTGLGSASQSSGSTDATTDGVIESVEMDGEYVYLGLSDADRVTEIAVRGPDGSEREWVEPKRGETAVRFTIGLIGTDRISDTYQPGTYEAIASGSDGGTDTMEIGRAELDLQPSVSVVGFRCLRGGVSQVVVENDGTGPGYIENVSVDGGVPGGTPGTGSRFGRSLAPGNRLFAPITVRSDSPMRAGSEETVAEWVGTTETATFSVTLNGESVTSDLDMAYEGGPVELDDGSYTFERVVGGDLA